MFHVSQFFMPFAVPAISTSVRSFHFHSRRSSVTISLPPSCPCRAYRPENECRGITIHLRSPSTPPFGSFFFRRAPRLIPASDLRVVHPITRLFPRRSHRYQDPDIRITGYLRLTPPPSSLGPRRKIAGRTDDPPVQPWD